MHESCCPLDPAHEWNILQRPWKYWKLCLEDLQCVGDGRISQSFPWWFSPTIRSKKHSVVSLEICIFEIAERNLCFLFWVCLGDGMANDVKTSWFNVWKIIYCSLSSFLSRRKCCKLLCYPSGPWNNHSGQRTRSQQQDGIWAHCKGIR